MSCSDFYNYLKSNKNVSAQQIPFYARWAKKFTEFSKSQSGLFLPDKLIEPFLRQFGERHAQWQVDQAREAINLYCYYLRMVSRELVKVEKVSLNDWKEAGNKMVHRRAGTSIVTV